VPVIAPVDEFILVPAGNAPDETEYTVDPTALTTVMFGVKLKEELPSAEPSAPAAGLFQVTTVTGVTDPVKARSDVTLLFVARIVNENVEEALVNVPETTPVDVFKLVPAGNVPDETEYTVDPTALTTEVFAVRLKDEPPSDAPSAPAAGLTQETTVVAVTVPVNERSVYLLLFVARIVNEYEEAELTNVPVTAPVDVSKLVPAGNAPDETEYAVEPTALATDVFAVKLYEEPPADAPRAPAAGLFQVTAVVLTTEPVNARAEDTP